MVRRRIRDELRAADIPATSDPDVLVKAISAYLGQPITVVPDPFLRRVRHVHARTHPRASTVELRIPADGPRAQMVCRALGEALYPGDPAAARSAAGLLFRHLEENREWARRTALDPIDAHQERAAGEQTRLFRPVLAPRPRRWWGRS
jgi:hypothetical protein